MKQKILALIIVITTLSANAEKIDVLYEKDPKTKDEVPVDVDISDDILNVKLIKDTPTSVIVTGPEGMVAHKYLSTQNGGDVDINLQNHEDGEYNITVINNNNGEIFEGDFTLSKNQ